MKIELGPKSLFSVVFALCVAAALGFQTLPPRDASPGFGGQDIAPSDSTEYSPGFKGLFVPVTGDVRVKMLSGQTVNFNDLAGGQIHPIGFTILYDTGTTETTGFAGIR
jgi:hypothetical protein